MKNPSRPLAAFLACVGALIGASVIAIPMTPVPITLQTLVVTVGGALLGARLATAAVLLWLVLAMFGMPVLANGGGGPGAFVGPSAGFLIAFPLAAAATGGLAARGWDRGFVRALAMMLLGHLVCLALGYLWLAHRIGPQGAWSAGILPYLPGALVKSLAGAVIVRRSGR